jgi:hypothetical protein
MYVPSNCIFRIDNVEPQLYSARRNNSDSIEAEIRFPSRLLQIPMSNCHRDFDNRLLCYTFYYFHRNSSTNKPKLYLRPSPELPQCRLVLFCDFSRNSIHRTRCRRPSQGKSIWPHCKLDISRCHMAADYTCRVDRPICDNCGGTFFTLVVGCHVLSYRSWRVSFDFGVSNHDYCCDCCFYFLQQGISWSCCGA